MNSYQTQASPSSVIVSSRDKRRIGLKPDQIKGKPLFVPGNMKSAPVNQYAGLWMRDSSKGKAKQDYKFIERILEFSEAQVSYFCKFFKLEQEGITQIIRFVSCIKDDELAMNVNAMINYIKSWPDPNKVPKPTHQKQKSVFSLRNEANNFENGQSKRSSFFSSSSTSPQDSYNINNSNKNSANSYSASPTPAYSQDHNQTPFFRASPNSKSPSSPITPQLINPYFSLAKDIRYSEIKEISRILINGISEITFDFPPNNQHFFLSLFNNNNNGNNNANFNLVGNFPQVRWPISLQISINDNIIKAAGTELINSFIDVSELNPKTLKFINQSPTDQIVVSIISANYKNYDQIAQSLQLIDVNELGGNNFSKSPMPNMQSNIIHPVNCLFCPITAKLMKYPGRGIQCQHQQCFDAKTYLKIMNRSGRNFCPICQKKIELNELALSVTTNVSGPPKSALDAVNKIRNENSSNYLSPSRESSPLDNFSNVNEMNKEEDTANNDIKLIGFTNDDIGFPNDQYFPEIGEPFSFELDNMPFSNEY